MSRFLTYAAVVIGIIVLILVCGTYGALAWGYAFSKLWLWFATPLGLPAIGLAHAVGIMLLVGMIGAGRYIKANKKLYFEGVEIEQKVPKNEAIATTITALLAPWLILGIGALVKYFM